MTPLTAGILIVIYIALACWVRFLMRNDEQLENSTKAFMAIFWPLLACIVAIGIVLFLPFISIRYILIGKFFD
jgi:hypothetical protein